MAWGWFGRPGTDRSRRSGVEGSGRRWLLADGAAPLGAKVSWLRALAGDAAPLVVRRSAAVQVLADLNAGTGVGAGVWPRRDRDGTAFQRDDVVHADGAPIAKAEDIGRAEAGGKAAVSGAAGGRPLAEASVVTGEESGKCGVGPFKGADVGQTQLLAEAVLKGAPEALDPTLACGERAPIHSTCSSLRTRPT